MNEAAVQDALAALDAITIPAPRPGRAPLNYAVFDGMNATSAINRLVAAAADKPVRTAGALATSAGSARLDVIWAVPLNPPNIGAQWDAFDAQTRIRLCLAAALASAARATVKISLASTNPWGATTAAYDLASAIGRLLAALDL